MNEIINKAKPAKSDYSSFIKEAHERAEINTYSKREIAEFYKFGKMACIGISASGVFGILTILLIEYMDYASHVKNLFDFFSDAYEGFLLNTKLTAFIALVGITSFSVSYKDKLIEFFGKKLAK